MEELDFLLDWPFCVVGGGVFGIFRVGGGVHDNR